MARYVNALTTLQARSINDAVRRFGKEIDYTDRFTIEKAAFKIVNYLIETFPDQFDKKLEKRMIACANCGCGLYGIEQGALSVGEYISMLAEHKEGSEKSLFDFGAFGDLIEILVRCALCRVDNFITAKVLYVKGYDNTDIISKKYGKLEVGHNGKTLSFGTVFDMMSGDYTGIVYGMFSEEDKKEIYTLCREEEYKKAVRFVAEYMCIWLDKYDFEKDMNNLTRGKGITLKCDGPQVVFNSGKYTAFQNAIEEGKFITVKDMMNRK